MITTYDLRKFISTVQPVCPAIDFNNVKISNGKYLSNSEYEHELFADKFALDNWVLIMKGGLEERLVQYQRNIPENIIKFNNKM